ncbi:MAG: hypothetical protein ACRD47_16410, partial [Nitrososphaeraceae archaeon]
LNERVMNMGIISIKTFQFVGAFCEETLIHLKAKCNTSVGYLTSSRISPCNTHENSAIRSVRRLTL